MPLRSSLPAAWNRPPPSALSALDWNTARGNLALLNQAARGSSASLSAKPTVALPVSTVIVTVPVCGAFGSSVSWASNLRNRPSIGTPLCLTWKVISLCAGTSLAGAAVCAPAAVASTSGASRCPRRRHGALTRPSGPATTATCAGAGRRGRGSGA